MEGKDGGGQGGGVKGGGGKSSGSGSDGGGMMKALGGEGLISRKGFESNPQGYFSGLHGSGKSDN